MTNERKDQNPGRPQTGTPNEQQGGGKQSEQQWQENPGGRGTQPGQNQSRPDQQGGGTRTGQQTQENERKRQQGQNQPGGQQPGGKQDNR